MNRILRTVFVNVNVVMYVRDNYLSCSSCLHL